MGRSLFVYGSLVSPASAAATLGRPVHAESVSYAAVLDGWQRSWNVASGAHSHPDRRMIEDGGREFTGVMAVLGIAPALGRHCTGAVCGVDDRDLLRLDARERNYQRADVTAQVHRAGRPWAGQVFTYVPRPASVQRLSAAAARGDAVVRRQYAELVESAFAAIGEEDLARYRTTTVATDLELRSLRFEWPARESAEGT